MKPLLRQLRRSAVRHDRMLTTRIVVQNPAFFLTTDVTSMRRRDVFGPAMRGQEKVHSQRRAGKQIDRQYEGGPYS